LLFARDNGLDIPGGVVEEAVEFPMLDRFLARVVDRARANADGVGAAPEAFVLLAIVTFGIPCFVLRQSFGERLAVLEIKLATQQALLADYRTRLRAASAAEAAPPIEEPAAGAPAGDRDGDRRTRDPQRLYADDIPVALVAAPAVNADEKTLTFPEVIAGMLLATDRPYQYKNWKLSCGGAQFYSAPRDEATREFSYSHLICKIVGER
jgi:hypothetical protein